MRAPVISTVGQHTRVGVHATSRHRARTSEGGESAREAGGEVGEAGEGRVGVLAAQGRLDLADEDGGHDEAVDAQDTRCEGVEGGGKDGAWSAGGA